MSLEYGYLAFNAYYNSNTNVYGNEFSVNETIYVKGLRCYVGDSKTGKIRLGTLSDIIVETSSTSFVQGWNEVMLDNPVQLDPNNTYLVQAVIDNSIGSISYTQTSSGVSINSKINNNGRARYGSFPGNTENGVWVGVDIIFDTEPPTPPTPTEGLTIELLNNHEELNKITKNPTLVRSLEGFLRDTTDIVDPEILIEFDGTLVDCNYMHIPQLNRWYFITKIESVRTKLWKIYAHCDVLKTYAEGLLNTECVVARNENRYNIMLNDSMFKVYANPRLQCANFPNKFEGESFVLVMNGANYTE